MSQTFTEIIILIVFFLIMIYIQIDLSKRNDKLKAFVLPILLFIRALIKALEVIETPMNSLRVFLSYNILTLILLLIHFYFRKKIKNKNR